MTNGSLDGGEELIEDLPYAEVESASLLLGKGLMTWKSEIVALEVAALVIATVEVEAVVKLRRA